MARKFAFHHEIGLPLVHQLQRHVGLEVELAQLLHVGINLLDPSKVDLTAAHDRVGASRERKRQQRSACLKPQWTARAHQRAAASRRSGAKWAGGNAAWSDGPPGVMAGAGAVIVLAFHTAGPSRS